MRDQAEKLRQLMKKTYTNNQQTVNKPSSVIKGYDIPKARVITVTSGKGGVGKTNFTVNLALALAGLGQRILVIDADLGMANVDVVLGCSTPYNLLNLLEDGLSIQDIIVDGPSGIKFMSGGSGISQLANLSDMELRKITSQIAQCDTMADIILIDTGAGLNQSVLNFVVAADEVIIITTPEPTAITDAYAMMKAYVSQQGTAPLRLVVNRVVEDDEGQQVIDKLVKVAFKFLGLELGNLGVVYEDRNMVKAVKSQSPVFLAFPDSISAHCIDNIARQLLGETTTKARGLKGFFSAFVRKLW